jgi:hypothetical protein
MEHCHLGLLSILVPAYEQMHMTSDLNSNVTNQSDLGLMLWTVHELSRHERMLAQPWAAARASPAAAHVPKQHDVDLHKVVRAEGVRPHRIDVLDLLVVVPDQVHQLCEVIYDSQYIFYVFICW